MRFSLGIVFLSLLSLSAQARIALEKIKLPPGFKIEFLAQVPNARGISVSPTGTIFVGSSNEGKIYAIARENLKTKEVLTITENQNKPVGVAYRNGDLFFSALDKIYRIANVEAVMRSSPRIELLANNFPKDALHGWKYIAFGPDGKLYVPVGAPCNICNRGSRYANIMRMNIDGSALEIFAEGIRNTVGFDWHPETKELWFTDNGRDLMGDDIPPDELNRAPQKGAHFGYPFCHGKDILDSQFGRGKSCKDYTPPVQNLGPHVAALGMKFYTGRMFPEEYKNQIFIAEHGSWNRSSKVGYRITLVKLDDAKKHARSYTPFAEGWLQGDSYWGRPVDIAVDVDGALLVSDDHAGAIYRISYTQNRTNR